MLQIVLFLGRPSLPKYKREVSLHSVSSLFLLVRSNQHGITKNRETRQFYVVVLNDNGSATLLVLNSL